VTGFEPATSWSQTTRSTKLSYTPHCRLIHIMRGNTAHPESLGLRPEKKAAVQKYFQKSENSLATLWDFGAKPYNKIRH
jgi:hypothetical protein